MPTATLQPDGAAGKDTLIYSVAPTTNYGTLDYVQLGDPSAGVSAAIRALLAFDISAIPAGATITAVTVYLWENDAASSGGAVTSWDVELRRILADWVEAQATWNIYSTGNNWATAGCSGAADCVAAASASVTLDGTAAAAFIEWSGAGLVADVQAWLDGTATNYGWLLSAPTAEYQGTTPVSKSSFRSSDYATAAQRPKLVVEYLETPLVTTTAITAVTSSGATGGGNVTHEGTSAVTARGVCWNTTGTPTTADSKTVDGSGAGAYASALTGLSAGTTYHVRAYATNEAGTVYGAEVEFTTRAYAASVWTPAESVRSLRIGSDTLGWQDFPADHLGIRTKVMPGGDGSLDFMVPGDFAWQHRNVITPEAQVVLTVDGETDFGGYLTCDPLRHRLGAQDTLELVATGPWGMAGRSPYAYLGVDVDPGKCFQVRTVYDTTEGDLISLEDTGKFNVDLEDRIHIKADKDRTFDNYAVARVAYWLFGGLDPYAAIRGITFDYKCHLPDTSWEFRVRSSNSPWQESTNAEFAELGEQAAWVANQNVDFSASQNCAIFELRWAANSTAPSPPTDGAPYVTIKNLRFWGRMDGANVDRSVTIADILADATAALGDGPGIVIGTTRITGLTTVADAFVVDYPSSANAVMSEALLLASAPVEAYFDHWMGGFRFTANARPASVDATRNRLWVVGGRGGEDLSGLQRDWEASPEQVEVLFGVVDDADLPDGTVVSAKYPAATASIFPLVEVVDVSGEMMTAAHAAQYAQTVYAARQDSAYAGDVALGATARTDAGQDLPTHKLRPGDRLKSPQLLDVDAAGLYVQNVSYDFRTGKCVATVGEPWDPLGFRPKSAASQVIGSGAHGGAGRLKRPYLRRSGVV